MTPKIFEPSYKKQEGQKGQAKFGVLVYMDGASKCLSFYPSMSEPLSLDTVGHLMADNVVPWITAGTA